MEIPNDLLQALVGTEEISTRGWYKRIDARWRQANCAYEKKIIALSLLVEKGLDPRPYSSPEERAELRQLNADLQSASQTVTTPGQPKKTAPSSSKATSFVLKDDFGDVPLNLNEAKMQEGRDTAQTYYYLWTFENSLRLFILTNLENQYGRDWWSSHVSAETQRNAADRQRTDRANRWHGSRGAHPIYYIDISDYKGIITKNWSVFEPFFVGLKRPQEWILNRIEEITPSRNIVAHMNPLTSDDRKRIQIYLRDWLRQINQNPKQTNP